MNLEQINFETCFDEGGNILALEFVLAAGAFVTVLDTQRNPAFVPVRARFMGNVDMMGTYLQQYNTQFRTLADMVAHEQMHHRPPADLQKTKSAALGLLWFTRAMQFLVESFFNSLTKPDESLANSFRAAYLKTLGLHHDGMVQGIFNAAMSVCPDRASFYSSLCGHDSMPQLVLDAKRYFTAMDRCRRQTELLCRHYGWNVDSTCDM